MKRLKVKPKFRISGLSDIKLGDTHQFVEQEVFDLERQLHTVYMRVTKVGLDDYVFQISTDMMFKS